MILQCVQYALKSLKLRGIYHVNIHFASQCKSTEPRLGFHCPLCREYIPSDGASGKPEDWAGLFPRNDILQKMIDKLDNQLCEPCLRDNDHEEALNYCLQCNEYLCTKCHKKVWHP